MMVDPQPSFEKKFNIGLTLSTNLKEFEEFLKRYRGYIHSFYFSPPLGRKFHTRTIIAQQMMFPHKVSLFWKMLHKIREYGIELELLLNTLCLDGDMIARASASLVSHGITPDSVCFLGQYAKAVERYFPNQKHIWSFNNGMRSPRELDQTIEQCSVDAFVLGSNFIRNNRFFRTVHERGKKVILLLNNGCSFNCETCNNVRSVCKSAFEQNLQHHSVEYLYALQSIFPDELRNGAIETEYVDLFKISNRGNKLSFVRNAMDSYIYGNVRSYLAKDTDSYAYWGRAGYFWKYFATMDLEEIVRYKRDILNMPIEVK